jgi:hypothetical protein
MQPAHKAQAVRRSLSAFFVIGGMLAFLGVPSIFTHTVAALLGLPSIALGIGVWRYWSIARWAGMGACFLLLVAAFALPLIITVPLEYNQFESPRRAEYLAWAFAGAFGLIGYWGLQYFRAPATKEAYAHSAEMLAAFRGESSSVVVTAALTVFCVWLMPSAIVWSEQSAEAQSLARNTDPKAMLPDLKVTGLCLQGDSLVQAVVANGGRSGSSVIHTVSYTTLQPGGPGPDASSARVPKAGSSGLVALDHAINPIESDGEYFSVRVIVDAHDQIRESNERNNARDFSIVFKDVYPGNLPKCPPLPEINGQ